MRQYIHIHSRNICVSHHFVSQNYAPSSFSVTARPHNVHSGWRLRVALPHRYKGCHHRQAKSHDGTCFNTCMHILSLAARTHAPELRQAGTQARRRQTDRQRAKRVPAAGNAQHASQHTEAAADGTRSSSRMSSRRRVAQAV